MARAYRKKPVVVEAVQWTGENHAEMCEFIDPEAFEIIPRIGLVIHTLEGDHHASPGDYIIKGVNGEFYPCKPDIFAKTYESSTLTPPNEWVSVEERKPKYNIREDGELVSSKILCYCETDKTVHLAVSRKFYTARKGEIVHPVFRYYDEWGDEIEDVSHWMLLPAPPDRRPPEGEVDGK